MSQTTMQTRMVTFLESHPRMMGALFTACLLLMQAGNAAAAAAATNNGP
jgi:hypothetical protein